LIAGDVLAFGAAMTYDWTVGAIGSFEMSEYVGIAAVDGALALVRVPSHENVDDGWQLLLRDHVQSAPEPTNSY
jgi:hypothetical protein